MRDQTRTEDGKGYETRVFARNVEREAEITKVSLYFVADARGCL